MSFKYEPRGSLPLLCIDSKATGEGWGAGRVRRYVRPAPSMAPRIVHEAMMPEGTTWKDIPRENLETFRKTGEFE